VRSVIPTLIQEVAASSKSIESKVDELASLPELELSDADREFIASIGNNKGCMELKGANRAHTTEAQADRWGLTHDHELVARRWSIDPDTDLACTHKAAAGS